ncbi:MAG: BMP family ABC transporter substrate-binding protein [Lachnospiraceae bacterium]
MRKILSILAVAMMSVSLLAGCGSSTTTEETDNSQTAQETTAISKEDIKVGVIHIGDPADGSGYSYTHDVGIQNMQAELALDDSQIVRKNNVADDDPTAVETAMRDCIEEGCNIIFATSWGYMETCAALAEEYPDVYFSHGTGYMSNGKNFNNYFGRIYQARYLSGIVAGMKTETNKIGYVAAMGVDNSEVTGGINAFAMGVQSVNEDAKVYVKVTNSWYDPEGETAAAQALVDADCDVIAQHCDTANPQLVAEKAGVYGIGYNSDMSKDAPKATLCSVMWNWGAYYTSAVQSIIDGTWDGSNYFGGMAEGLVQLSDLADFAADGTADAVEAASAKILDGSFNVFDGVMNTNDGKTVGEEGSTLSDADITGGINWYYENVEVK